MSGFLQYLRQQTPDPIPGPSSRWSMAWSCLMRVECLHTRQPVQTGGGTGKPVKIFVGFCSCTYIDPDTINRFIRPYDGCCITTCREQEKEAHSYKNIPVSMSVTRFRPLRGTARKRHFLRGSHQRIIRNFCAPLRFPFFCPFPDLSRNTLKKILRKRDSFPKCVGNHVFSSDLSG